MRRIFKNRKGFSLAELMVVVTIICVLFGVVAINVVKYQKKIRQLRYDSYAQIIYEAAQNRLTEMFAANGASALQVDSADPVAEVPSESSTNNTVIVTDLDDHKLLFPVGSISEELISKQWAVEYDPNNGFVYAAFYADENCSTFKEASERNNWRTKDDETGLRNNATVGYYGSTGPQPSYNQLEAGTCRLIIINKDVLRAHIEVGVPAGTQVSAVYYAITSESGGYYTSSITGASGSISGNNWVCDLILDSLKGNNGFERFCTEDTKIKAGEDITVTVYASFSGSNVENTPLVSAKANSFFAEYDESTNEATVRYGRHLQNLGRIAGIKKGELTIPTVMVKNVIQDKSIDFTRTTEANSTQNPDPDLWANVYRVSVSDESNEWLKKHSYMPFIPITNSNIETYSSINESGFGCTITGLVVTGEDTNGKITEEPVSGNGGLFGTFNGQSISGVNLVGAYVNADGDAGALAGSIEPLSSENLPVTISNCTSYLLYPDYSIYSGADGAQNMQWIKSSSENAGGLFGSATGSVDINYCSSSSVVYSVTKNAGGFFGNAVTVKMDHSYADCYVFGRLSSGGMGGNITSSPTAETVKNCYSAGFLFSPVAPGKETQKAGGYIPEKIPTDDDSYSLFSYNFGKVNPEAAKDRVDYPGGSASEGFVQPASISSSDKTKATTAYNIGKIDCSSYGYPMIRKLNRTGNTADDLMHHYGDWEGETGLTVLWDNQTNNKAVNKMITQTPTGDPTQITPEQQEWNLPKTEKIFTLDPLEMPDNTAYYPEPVDSDKVDTTEISWKDFRYNGVRYTFINWLDSNGEAYEESEISVGDRIVNGLVNANTKVPEKELKVGKTYTAQYDKKCNIEFYLVDNAGVYVFTYVVPEDFSIETKFKDIFQNVEQYVIEKGFVLDGNWYLDKDCKGTPVNHEDAVQSDKVLYARLKCPVTYVAINPVDKDPTDPDNIYTYPTPIVVDYGTVINLSDAPEEDEFTDYPYHLDGDWYDSPDCSNKVGNSKVITTSTTFYAKWKCEVKFKSKEGSVTINNNGIETSLKLIEPQSLGPELFDYGTKISAVKPQIGFDKGKTEFEIGPWCSDDQCTKKLQYGENEYTIIKDQPLYAQWNGIVLSSQEYINADGMPIQTFSPTLDSFQLSGYTMHPTQIKIGTKDYKFDSWGFGEDSEHFTPVFTALGYANNSYVATDGIQVYQAKWTQIINNYNGVEIKGSGYAKGYAYGNQPPLDGGIFILGNLGYSNGNKTNNSSIVRIYRNTESEPWTIGNKGALVDVKHGNGGSGMVIDDDTANPDCMWNVSKVGSNQYILCNILSGKYLGLSVNNENEANLILMDESNSLFATNTVWTISSVDTSKEFKTTMSMTMPNGTTYYISYSGGGINQPIGVSTDRNAYMYLYGGAFVIDSRLY